MDEAGAIGYMHGHNHFIQAYKDANTGRLIFSSASTVFNEKYGVMYFDVYKDSMICFWQPVKGATIPLGIFDLKKAVSDNGEKIINTVPVISKIKPTEAVIKWQTNPSLDSSLIFRKKEDEPWISRPVSNRPTGHEIKIENLEPGTEYQFYVNADHCEYATVRSEIINFKTPAE